MKELKEVIMRDNFGICPHCGRLMFILKSEYTLYAMTETGAYPNRIVSTEDDLTMACICGFTCPMVNTVEGLRPRNYYKIKDKPKPKRLIIGYVDERR